MVISYIMGGTGNQLFQYAAGRRLALKLNTELKLDTTYYDTDHLHPYTLDQFNIDADIAAPEEIAHVKNSGGIKEEEAFDGSANFMPEVLNYPDNVCLFGYWSNEKYFEDIRDILLKEFTLRQPLGASARHWQKKILAAECSVSIHVRHGDFAYSPLNANNPAVFSILPLEYYYDCIERLRRQYGNVTLFVFSNNLNWCKENLRAGVPTEFVCGEGLSDIEEFHLMSLCKHNITANSTFSWWGAWLNQNPDKKVFVPIADRTKDNHPAEWIRVPFDMNRKTAIEMRPYFSLLLVVNDDAATIQETLGNILNLDYKFYDVVIIDNASTDGSGKLCRQVAQTQDNITLIKLWDRVSDGAAWNKALDVAQGKYVMFLKGNDRLFNDALSSLYMLNEHLVTDIVHSVKWIREDERGDINLVAGRFSLEEDVFFRDMKEKIRAVLDKPTILKILANGNYPLLGTKIFKREFLLESGIRFKDNINGNSIVPFVTEAMFQAEVMLFVPNVVYVAPKIF